MTALFWRTVPRTLHWLAASSVGLLCLKVFLLNGIPEPIRGMHSLGFVVEGLLASVLASYVFYLIVIHVKETRDRAAIYPHVLRRSKNVVGDCMAQLADFSRVAETPVTLDTVTTQNLNAMFKTINPNSAAPLMLTANTYATWLQYFSYYKNRSKGHISKVMAQLFFLEAGLVSRLTAVDDSSHFNFVDVFAHQPTIPNNDLTFLTSTFMSYCEACRALDSFLKEHPLAAAAS